MIRPMSRSAGQPPSRLAILSFFCVTLASRASASEPVRVQFFYSPGCRMCAQAQDAVKATETQHGDSISVERIDTTTPGAVERLFERLDAAKVAETDSLVVFVDDVCLSGGDAIVSKLDETIAEAIRARASPDDKMNSRESGNPEKKELKPSQPSQPFDRLGFWTVSAAGLADGINPCAFATIVLFASMMTVAGRSKRAILVIGGVFALTVYATYFCIGYFFFSVFEWMRLTPSLSIISNIVYLAAVGACVLFAILSGIDSFRAWMTGSTDKMLLSLPAALKNRIARTMSRTARSASLVVSAVAAGVVVSILESACTGQIYFPLLAGLARIPGRRADALLTLLWYNLLFVLPLAVVVIASAFGLSNQRIAEFGRKRLPLTKALLAAVFLAMAVWMASGIR